LNLLIDPENGVPRWDSGARKLGPKEDFALEAACRLQAGTLSLDELKEQIIAAANDEWASRGKKSKLRTLNDVKKWIGKSGKDWFFELQRVFMNDELLNQLIDQEGRGLTALARLAGPIQSQRRKGYANEVNTSAIKDLIELLEEARRKIDTRQITDASIASACSNDLIKYRILLENLDPAK
jgi:hypothetical protein